jgi:hypothetical protein
MPNAIQEALEDRRNSLPRTLKRTLELNCIISTFQIPESMAPMAASGKSQRPRDAELT